MKRLTPTGRVILLAAYEGRAHVRPRQRISADRLRELGLISGSAVRPEITDAGRAVLAAELRPAKDNGFPARIAAWREARK